MCQPVFDFVIHKHFQADNVHWDLMLAEIEDEDKGAGRDNAGIGDTDGASLATWKFDTPPINENFCPSLIGKRIFNHRKVYLEYEGDISNNRGRCEIFDKGTYYLIERKEDYRKIFISGRNIKGVFILAQLSDNSQTDSNSDYWIMTLLNNYQE